MSLNFVANNLFVASQGSYFVINDKLQNSSSNDGNQDPSLDELPLTVPLKPVPADISRNESSCVGILSGKCEKEIFVHHAQETAEHVQNQKLSRIKYFKCVDEAAQSHQDETMTMENATEFLPPLLLVQHGFVGMIKDKIVKRAISLINSVLTQKTGVAWNIWVSFTEASRLTFQSKYAVKIQCFFRKFLARMRVSHLIAKKQEEIRNKLALLELRELAKLNAITTIQSLIRGFIVKRKLKLKISRSRSASKIQGWWRCIQFHFRCLACMIQVRRYIIASILIQKKFRQFYSKGRVYRIRKQKMHKLYHQACSCSSSYQRFFLVYGCAYIIQHWWTKGIRWRNKIKYQSNLDREAKVRRRCAVMIQSLYRGCTARRYCHGLRQQYKQQLEYSLYRDGQVRHELIFRISHCWCNANYRRDLTRISACVTIQSRWRCCVAYGRYKRYKSSRLVSKNALLNVALRFKSRVKSHWNEAIRPIIVDKSDACYDWIANRACDVDVSRVFPFRISVHIIDMLPDKQNLRSDVSNAVGMRRNGMDIRLSVIKLLLPIASKHNNDKDLTAKVRIIQSFLLRSAYVMRKRKRRESNRRAAIEIFKRHGLINLIKNGIIRLNRMKREKFELIFQTRIKKMIMIKFVYRSRASKCILKYHKSLKLVQALARRYLTKIRARRDRNHVRRRRCELTMAGKKMYDLTFESCCFKELLNGLVVSIDKQSRKPKRVNKSVKIGKIKAKIVENNDENEFEEFFKLFCTSEDRAELDVTRFLKFCKETPGLLDNDSKSTGISLTSNYVQVVFSRIVSKCKTIINEEDDNDDCGNRLNLAGFIMLLYEISLIKYQNEFGSQLSNDDEDDAQHEVEDDTKQINLADIVHQFSPSRRKSLIERSKKFGYSVKSNYSSILSSMTHHDGLKGQITFAPFFGWQGVLMKLIVNYVRHNKRWDLTKFNYMNRAARHSIISCTMIQRTFRGHWVRSFLYPRIKSNQINSKINRVRLDASIALQRSVRGFVGRRRSSRLAQKTYIRMVHISDTTGQVSEYYINQNNGSRFEGKPWLFRNLPAGIAVQTPKTGRKYSVLCSCCKSNLSKLHCHECDEPYCLSCYSIYHKSTSRALHHGIDQDNCSMCCVQVSTKFCQLCSSDGFCDTCFAYLHSKSGRLRFHRFKWISQICQVCFTWSASVTCDGLSACEVCASSRSESTWSLINYIGRPIAKFRQKLKEEEDRLRIQSQYEGSKEKRRLMKLIGSATDIQRVWRSHHSRIIMRDFLTERRDWLNLRRSEDRIRDKMSYKVLDVIGHAPQLASDTPKECVEKKYVLWARNSLGAAVGSWRETYGEYQSDVETSRNIKLEFGLDSGFLSRINYTRNIIKLVAISCPSVLSQSISSSRRYKSVQSKLEVKLQDLRQAQYSGKSDKVTRPMIEAASEIQKDLSGLKIDYDETSASCNEILSKAKSSIIGPSGLSSHVSDLYAKGKLLPFTVRSIKGKRFVIVELDSIIQSKRAAFNWKLFMTRGSYLRISNVLCMVDWHRVIIDSEQEEKSKSTVVLDLRQRIELERKNEYDDDDDDDEEFSDDDDDLNGVELDVDEFDETSDKELMWSDYLAHLDHQHRIKRKKDKLKWTLQSDDASYHSSKEFLIPIDKSWPLDSANHLTVYSEFKLPALKQTMRVSKRLFVKSRPSQALLNRSAKIILGIRKKLVSLKDSLDDDGRLVTLVDAEIVKLNAKETELRRFLQDFETESSISVYKEARKQIKVAKRILKFFYLKYGRKMGLVEPEPGEEDEDDDEAEEKVQEQTTANQEQVEEVKS